MPFRHSCFISYRHAQHQLMRRFVQDFHEALASELEALVELPLYRDAERLQGGDFFNPALSRGLCESVCMIMVFTPTYFSHDHSYCAREFAAMTRLEQQRLPARPEQGLIIPVSVRGFDQVPDEIKSTRQVYKFDHFTMSGPKLIRDKKFDIEISRIANYVAARCKDLRALSIDCDGFAIPGHNDAEVVSLLSRTVGSGPAFPGRGDQ